MYTWKELQTALDLYEKWDYRSTWEPTSFRRWLQGQINQMTKSSDCMCNHTECICLEKDWVCPNCKFAYEVVNGKYRRCACSFEPIIADAEDKDIYVLWEIVENIDDTCQNWYIRRWIPEALKLIHKILTKQPTKLKGDIN